MGINFSRFVVSNSDTYQASLDFIYHIQYIEAAPRIIAACMCGHYYMGVATIASHARSFFSIFVAEIWQKMSLARFYGTH